MHCTFQTSGGEADGCDIIGSRRSDVILFKSTLDSREERETKDAVFQQSHLILGKRERPKMQFSNKAIISKGK